MTTPIYHQVTVSMLLVKTPRNKNGIGASYQRGRHGENTKARILEGLSAWFLGFADRCRALLDGDL
jgi:hypothetical protein